MTTLRNLRDLISEALNETIELVSFLIRKADDRWINPPQDEQP